MVTSCTMDQLSGKPGFKFQVCHFLGNHVILGKLCNLYKPQVQNEGGNGVNITGLWGTLHEKLSLNPQAQCCIKLTSCFFLLFAYGLRFFRTWKSSFGLSKTGKWCIIPKEISLPPFLSLSLLPFSSFLSLLSFFLIPRLFSSLPPTFSYLLLIYISIYLCRCACIYTQVLILYIR